MMIIGIEETTDMRNPETRLQRFTSLSAALRWAADSGKPAWRGAADINLPPSQQNWHLRVRTIYQTPYGWRLPTLHAWRQLHHTDRRSLQTFQAAAVHRVGVVVP